MARRKRIASETEESDAAVMTSEQSESEYEPNNAAAASSTSTVTAPATSTHAWLDRIPAQQKALIVQWTKQVRSKQMTVQQFLMEVKGLLGDKLFEEFMATQKAGTKAVKKETMADTPAANVKRSTVQVPIAAPKKEKESTEDMDATALQDVVRYAGIDLKAESEQLRKETEMLGTTASSLRNTIVDTRTRPDVFCHLQRLQQRVHHTARQYQLQHIEQRCYALLAIAVQWRLKGLVEAAVRASRARVDQERAVLDWRVINDPRKQHWAMERVSRDFELNRQATADATSHNPSTVDTMTPAVESTNMDLDDEEEPNPTPETAPDQVIAAAAATAMQNTPAQVIRSHKRQQQSIDREEAVRRVKQTNNTALAALGLSKKSWMKGSTTAVAATPPSSTASASAPIPAVDQSTPFQQQQQISADKIFRTQTQRRLVLKRDVMRALEREARTRATDRLLYRHYVEWH